MNKKRSVSIGSFIFIDLDLEPLRVPVAIAMLSPLLVDFKAWDIFFNSKFQTLSKLKHNFQVHSLKVKVKEIFPNAYQQMRR